MNDTELQFPLLEKAREERTKSAFLRDVISGLSNPQKSLSSKYFYDQAGDALFQEIMRCPEYYPSSCEMEIFVRQNSALAEAMRCGEEEFDLIELGAGDVVKTHYLLKYLIDQEIKFKYKAIDISENILNYLAATLPAILPGIEMEGLNGDYLEMLRKAMSESAKRQIVLFLGSSIGNMNMAEAAGFCLQIRQMLSAGDMLLIGMDLRKNPKTILAAYNDASGFTKHFNLNLLSRINAELGADFDIGQFEHFPTYDPATGVCKSYLVSLITQVVQIGEQLIYFEKDEVIDMEISQKYTLEETRGLAEASGFRTVANFYDEKCWFLDTLWVAV